MSRERGAVLIVSLIFLLLMTLLATSSMQNATLQEKMAGTLQAKSTSFQRAESVLRTAEGKVMTPGFSLPECQGPVACLPPPDALTLSSGGGGDASGEEWVASGGGFYRIQHLGQTDDPAGGEASATQHRLYRVTAVVVHGTSRTVLESVHTQKRRIMWRQRQ